ncbi:MAG: hypothetical protein GXO26_08430 [Crenarchaeota archaeon]|nr:hypothetical protein [Thermoproteota archaeon]
MKHVGILVHYLSSIEEIRVERVGSLKKCIEAELEEIEKCVEEHGTATEIETIDGMVVPGIKCTIFIADKPVIIQVKIRTKIGELYEYVKTIPLEEQYINILIREYRDNILKGFKHIVNMIGVRKYYERLRENGLIDEDKWKKLEEIMEDIEKYTRGELDDKEFADIFQMVFPLM